MKNHRIIAATLITSILLTLICPDSVYAGIFNSKKAKLNAPENYTYYWDGDSLICKFDAIDGASGYELRSGNKPILLNGSSFSYHPSAEEKKAGSVLVSYYLRAVPSNSKKTDPSDYVFLNIISNIPSKTINEKYSASLLSKDELVSWLQKKDLKPTVSQDNKYTIVSTTLETNSDAIKDGASFARNHADEIMEYHMDNDNSDLKFIEDLLIAGALGAIDSSLTDKSKHLIYYYPKGYESFSAQAVTFDCLVSDNKEPDFSNLPYDRANNCYYYDIESLNRRIQISYKQVTKDSQKRWLITAMPSGYIKTYKTSR